MRSYSEFVSPRSLGVLVFLTALGLGGCGTKKQMMPSPSLFDTQGIDLDDITSPGHRTNHVRVFYATDRTPIESSKPDGVYGGDRGLVLRLGEATVQFGEDGLAWEDLGTAMRAGDGPPATVTATREFGPLYSTIPSSDLDDFLEAEASDSWDDEIRRPAREFIDAINAQLAGATLPDVIIFVPGFNTDFSWPVRITSELAYFAGQEGVFMAYCWPATGDIFSYAVDQVTAVLSARNLRELLLLISEETDVRRIHLISYSASAPIVNNALYQIRLMHSHLDRAALREKVRIGNVIYAGPDIDVDVFRSRYADGLEDVAYHTTVYTSEYDKSLDMSRSFGGMRYSRLGSPEEGLTEGDRESLQEEVVSAFVDVGEAQRRAGKGSHGHSYWYQNPWVSSDVLMMLLCDLVAADRGLVRGEGETMWRFPANYPQRVQELAAYLEAYYREQSEAGQQ